METQSKTALLIIDIINTFRFENGDQLFTHTMDILPNIMLLKEKAAARRIPVIYINDHYGLWQADKDKIIDHCRTEENAGFLTEIAPKETDLFLIKPKHSAFYGTALRTLLAQLQTKNLIVTGIAGNICVLFTANDAYMREYNLWCPEDCIASADQNDNLYALKMMQNVLKAYTGKSNDIQIPFQERN